VSRDESDCTARAHVRPDQPLQILFALINSGEGQIFLKLVAADTKQKIIRVLD
jgi:hypothetical protein